MGWIDDVEIELARARAAAGEGNAGKARTASRRAAGYALDELGRRIPGRMYGEDFIRQLRGVAADEQIPEEVRNAAARLQARISTDFVSDSADPVQDARIIIVFVQQELEHRL